MWKKVSNALNRKQPPWPLSALLWLLFAIVKNGLVIIGHHLPVWALVESFFFSINFVILFFVGWDCVSRWYGSSVTVYYVLFYLWNRSIVNGNLFELQLWKHKHNKCTERKTMISMSAVAFGNCLNGFQLFLFFASFIFTPEICTYVSNVLPNLFHYSCDTCTFHSIWHYAIYPKFNIHKSMIHIHFYWYNF